MALNSQPSSSREKYDVTPQRSQSEGKDAQAGGALRVLVQLVCSWLCVCVRVCVCACLNAYELV